MSYSWKGGSTASWRRVRRDILAANRMNNGGRCQVQIKGTCTGVATCVHHTRGKAHGDDPRYLLASCQECNIAEGNPADRSPAARPVTRWVK